MGLRMLLPLCSVQQKFELGTLAFPLRTGLPSHVTTLINLMPSALACGSPRFERKTANIMGFTPSKTRKGFWVS